MEFVHRSGMPPLSNSALKNTFKWTITGQTESIPSSGSWLVTGESSNDRRSLFSRRYSGLLTASLPALYQALSALSDPSVWLPVSSSGLQPPSFFVACRWRPFCPSILTLARCGLKMEEMVRLHRQWAQTVWLSVNVLLGTVPCRLFTTLFAHGSYDSSGESGALTNLMSYHTFIFYTVKKKARISLADLRIE